MDEFGPLEVRPRAGAGWYRQTRPGDLPATYTRKQGVRHLLAALDHSRDRLHGHVKKRKRWKEFLPFLKYLRSLYPPAVKLYVIQDNFSPHRRREVREWAENHQVELVFTPTNASWLNPIECHFAPLREFALNNSNYRDHAEQARAIRRYIAWRNAHRDDPRILRLQKRKKVG